MSEEIKLVRIQFRRDTANNWKGVNPVLADGEMGVESDTNKFKFGNGTSTWNELGYAGSEAGNIPTKLSELENDAGFITLSDVEVAGFIKQGALTDYALKSEIPTKTSDLTNDSDFVTKAEENEIIGTLSALKTTDKTSLVAAINELYTLITESY